MRPAIPTGLFGAVEGGGTKFVCAIGRSPLELLERVTVPTTDARTTLEACADFFVGAGQRHGQIEALGFGCFGPIELRTEAANYGRMLSTPKPGWSDVDVLSPLRSILNVPIALDIDVGVAALAEWQLGAGRGLASLAYVTVGTGIGGAVAPSWPMGRLMHAEMGHIPVRRDPRDAGFAGCCPFHGDCLEGLASGPAIQARWGCSLDALPADHEGRSLIAGYLGQMVASIALMHAVERIAIGGGVMSDGTLLPLIRVAASTCLNGYLPWLARADRMAHYVCAPALDSRAGITGALLLAQQSATSAA
jgi:fructokinase